MKKATLLLAMALLLLSACGGTSAEDTPFEWPVNPNVEQKNDSLTVFCIGVGKDSQMIQLALQRYRALYPDVEVELVQPEYSDYDSRIDLYTQFAAQIMAGEGPDVFIIDDTVMDVEKLVRQGVFADMEPFFSADQFDWEPYNQTIMDGGVWDGRRFTVPLSYDFPLLITTKSALEETGFDMAVCKDYLGFLEETTRYMEDSNQSRRLFFNPAIVAGSVTDFSGLAVADYSTKTVDLSSLVFQEGIQWDKTLAEKHSDAWLFDLSTLSGAAAVRDGKALWAPSTLGALNSLYYDFGALKTTDEAVMMPLRDLNGGIQAEIKYPAAVRANSENLQNAYNYIKILLSSEVQCAFSREELSVLNSANEYFYQENAAGRLLIIPTGTQGFTSNENPLQAVDWPTPEEFQMFTGFTQEITGTNYYSHLMVYRTMRPYIYEGADFEETKKAAQKQLEVYISE